MADSNNRCGVDGCDKPYYAKGWCKNHYRKNAVPQCKEDGCEKPVSAQGWCGMHYMRWRQHGDVNAVNSYRRPVNSDESKRWCNNCTDWHPLSEFSTYTGKRAGQPVLRRASSCAASNEERRKERRAAQLAADPEGVRARDRLQNIKRLYGQDAAQWYEETLAAQGGRCAICGTSPADGVYMHIDHDHACCERGSCGQCRRGILCVDCNHLLGRAKDDPAILMRAIQYLNKEKAPPAPVQRKDEVICQMYPPRVS